MDIPVFTGTHADFLVIVSTVEPSCCMALSGETKNEINVAWNSGSSKYHMNITCKWLKHKSKENGVEFEEKRNTK